ncbi:Protein FAM136A [Labeo rohita]|uniref:Protein FAM136A n=1 Tax=Labeo rohita TaxID=84645 RepID=A0ABQ8LA78_LABRO|nr:Protein FAM136A [Labeo rohita]
MTEMQGSGMRFNNKGPSKRTTLTSIEGKILFSVMAKRMTTYMVKNKYVDTSIQKGGIPGISGCLEHTGQGKQRQSSSCMAQLGQHIWINSSQLHQCSYETLSYPPQIRGMITRYLEKFKFLVHFTTQWQDLEKGIVGGRGGGVGVAIMESGTRQPPIRVFMDDLTITALSHVQARWILKGLDDVAM